MPKYISLLRGINVSGQKKIKMLALRELYSSLGFKNVDSYIQSGNLVFDSKLENPLDISNMITSTIKNNYQFEVPVIIYTAQEFSKIYKNNPFAKNYDDKLLKFYTEYLKDNHELISLYSFKTKFKNSDFIKEYNTNIAKLYVTFLANSPKNPARVDFSKWQTKNEKLIIAGKHIYLYYPEGYGKSKLTNNILERELGLVASTRNWRTVQKLVSLSIN